MDRRRERRWPRQLEVRFWRRGEEDVPHRGVAMNVSRTGIFVRSTVVLPSGARVRVEVQHGHDGFVVEAVVAWFYRMLRNAVIDRHRRKGAAARGLESLTREMGDEHTPPREFVETACGCVKQLSDTLKPEYADALNRVEVEGVAVKDYADQVGISANNAAVRVHRAREALKKRVMQSCGTCAEHGCVDCTCSH